MVEGGRGHATGAANVAGQALGCASIPQCGMRFTRIITVESRLDHTC